MKILMADDDPDLLELCTYALRRRGYAATVAGDGEQALHRWEMEEPGMVILDVDLPFVDGLEVCRRIRAESPVVPIMMISGMATEEHIIRALEAGADEFVAKPFSTTQLSLRIEAMSRRLSLVSNDFQGNIRAGDLEVNPEYCSVRLNGSEIRLTRMEFRVLYCLAANAGKVVVTDKLADFAWQGVGEGDPSLLKTHISRIRRKLGLPPNRPGFIRSVPGLGYTLSLYATDTPAEQAAEEADEEAPPNYDLASTAGS